MTNGRQPRAGLAFARVLAPAAECSARWPSSGLGSQDSYGLAYVDVGDVVLDEHDRRQRNPGSGDWIAQSGRLTVVYNWPDEDDQSSARVITAWLSG